MIKHAALSLAIGLFAAGCAVNTAEPAAESEEAALSSGVAAFDALDADAKMNFLYRDYESYAWSLDLQDGFTLTPITIAKLPRSVAEAGELTLNDLRQGAFENGGDAELFVIKNGRVTYAYVIHASGRSWGNWSATSVYDRHFVHFGGFSAAD